MRNTPEMIVNDEDLLDSFTRLHGGINYHHGMSCANHEPRKKPVVLFGDGYQ